ncbi:MAG: hypothetical protein M4579_004009 [Chaenotheca gracillima]|nr:MAG: hypothetical protein M4579_004009 [Chaenotheca gracillima]
MGGKANPKGSYAHQPGVYRDDPDRDDAASTSSAIPMGDSEYADADTDGILPAYTDDVSDFRQSATIAAPTTYDIPDSSKTIQDKIIQTTIVHDKLYSTDAKDLHQFVLEQAKLPPRPVVRVVGTHSETRKDSKGKNETSQITDFDLKLDLTPYIIVDCGDGTFDPSWTYLRVVENGQKALRGGRTKARAKGWSADLEVASAAPSLADWTQQYCEDPARLRTFTLDRTIEAMDQEIFTNRLPSIIRTTGYRGHIKVTFPIDYGRVQVYSPSRINRWRTSRWIPWLFYLTFLWLFTWPYLWWSTRRYAVVRSVWQFAKTDATTGQRVFASVSEERVVGEWAKAVKAAALSRRQGMLTQDDMEHAERPEAPRRQSSGNEFVDGAVGFLAGAAGVVSNLQQSRGWGGDS